MITYLIRYVAMIKLETSQYDTFYRIKPGAANLTAIVFECWNAGTMALAILTRAAKLILIVLLFIGRVDRHFLANDLSKKQSTWVPRNLHVPCIFQYSHVTTSHFNTQVTITSTHTLSKNRSLVPQMHVSNRLLLLLLIALAFESKT